jgi:hypothetical protein
MDKQWIAISGSDVISSIAHLYRQRRRVRNY